MGLFLVEPLLVCSNILPLPLSRNTHNVPLLLLLKCLQVAKLETLVWKLWIVMSMETVTHSRVYLFTERLYIGRANANGFLGAGGDWWIGVIRPFASGLVDTRQEPHDTSTPQATEYQVLVIQTGHVRFIVVAYGINCSYGGYVCDSALLKAFPKQGKI